MSAPPIAHGDRPAAVPRRGRQVGPAPAVPVAGRRHGGPDAGLRPDPRRHHGDRRRLPDVPDQPDPASARPTQRHGSPSSGPPPPSSPRPSPAPRTTSRRSWPTRRSPSSATCSSPPAAAAYVAAIFLCDARLLQGPALPRRRLGDPRHGRRAGHRRRWAPCAKLHAGHGGDVPHRLAVHRRASRRSPASGRRATSS